MQVALKQVRRTWISLAPLRARSLRDMKRGHVARSRATPVVRLLLRQLAVLLSLRNIQLEHRGSVMESR